MDLEIWLLRSTHFGKIGFRLSVVSLCCVLAILLSIFFSTILFLIVALVGIAILILSFGLVLAVIPDYLTKYNALLNNSGAITDFLFNLINYTPYFAIVGIISGIIGCVFLSLNKTERHWGQFTFCVVTIILCLIICILSLTGALNSFVG